MDNRTLCCGGAIFAQAAKMHFWKTCLKALVGNQPAEAEQDHLLSRRLERNRKWVAALAALGILDSGYLWLYQTGRVRHLWCPGFGKACERISSSPKAYQWGIADGLWGMAGYGTLLGLALAGKKDRYRTQPALPVLMGASTLAGLGLSALLVYEQKAKFDDYCIWCLISAAISTLTVPAAMPEFLSALRTALPGDRYESDPSRNCKGATTNAGHRKTAC